MFYTTGIQLLFCKSIGSVATCFWEEFAKLDVQALWNGSTRIKECSNL